MIKVEKICFRDHEGSPPRNIFIVKNKEKIKFWKMLSKGVGYFWEIKITELKGGKKNGK